VSTGKAERYMEEQLENKICLWQEVAEYINRLIAQKEIKKLWEAIRNITRRKRPLISVESHKWVLFSRIVFYKQ
jgi:hypothetical protein